jgi:hypothetical protein
MNTPIPYSKNKIQIKKIQKEKEKKPFFTSGSYPIVVPLLKGAAMPSPLEKVLLCGRVGFFLFIL